MVGHIGIVEILFASLNGLLIAAIRVALATWAILTRVRIRNGVDCMAAAAGRLAGLLPRTP